ncbi:AAA family ATPase [Pseudomonas sp. H1h]|uniref:AAA family ATPase n=1 Tax=Pseudomonas sp. H1h TaxID=1397280 RepID=UPI0021096983|nr:AAA family ATPase [Pseudomonas sp. H1h]
MVRGDFEIPSALQVENLASEMSELKKHYDLPEYSRLTRRPKLNAEIWRSKNIRSALFRVFKGKCAYCESSIVMEGVDVHHHRPLMNAKGDAGNMLKASADHYAWYAYEWNNLILLCMQCSRFKANLFPTVKDRIPPFTPWEDADQEEPQLLDPCRDNVFEHLSFKLGGRCLGKSRRGKHTINILKLNRSDLVSHREESFYETLTLLGTLRGLDYVECLRVVKKHLSEGKVYIGATKTWISEGLIEVSGSKSPLKRGQFETELAGFVSISDEKRWKDFCVALTGKDFIPVKSMRSVEVELEDYESNNKLSRISSLSISNFKGIGKLEMSFASDSSSRKGVAPAAVLLGENSTGKSSILQAIAIGLMSPKLRGQLNVDFNFFRKRNGPLSSEAKFSEFNSAENETFIEVTFDSGRTSRVNIRLDGSVVSDDSLNGLVLAYGAHRNFGDESNSTGYFRRASSVESLFDRSKSIPHSMNWLETVDEEKFVPIARAMREILDLKGNQEIVRLESKEIFISSPSGDVSLMELSDGYRALFAVALDIMRNMIREWGNLEDSRGTVLIDEIETHLHPRWKMQVVGALRQAMPQVQFIFTTHDPLCLRGMLKDEVHVLVKNESGVVNEMTGLPDVTGMRAEQLLTSEFFGLASTSDPAVTRELDRKILSGSGDTKHLERFSEQLASFSLIGDTPEQQVVNEALRLHIIEELHSKKLDRANVRKEAVELILQKLRAHSAKGVK